MEALRVNWFTDQRQQWIAETVGIFGFINREHIERKFGVSAPQASGDLRDFMKRNPDTLVGEALRRANGAA
jgi:hypothetical protein